MAKVVIDEAGVKRYVNKRNVFNRVDGPAVIYPHGTTFHFIDGMKSSSTDPSFQGMNGNRFWYLNGSIYREAGPSLNYPNGLKRWTASYGKVTWPEL